MCVCVCVCVRACVWRVSRADLFPSGPEGPGSAESRYQRCAEGKAKACVCPMILSSHGARMCNENKARLKIGMLTG